MQHRIFPKFSRRSFIGGATALGATTALTGAVRAEDLLWEQLQKARAGRLARDSDNNVVALEAIDSQHPVMSMQTAYALEQASRKYQTIAATGGWPEPTQDMFKLVAGDSGDAVKRLQHFLVTTGDLPEDFNTNGRFEKSTDIGVRTFQARHGLVISGQVGEETWYAMAVPVEQRLAQININLRRVGTMAPTMPDTYVLVNIPAALIEVAQTGAVFNRHTAVVGRIDRQTPILKSAIYQINFNPYWTVPKSIIRRDLIDYMNKDPNYLANYNIRIFDGRGNELNASDIDWTTDDAVQYTFRQDPGAENSLGHVRINFHNPYSVYLHDTPAKSLFGENQRFHSSGCVRVEDVDELVAFVLSNNGGWDVNSVDAMFSSGERMDVDVAKPVPIQTTYISAWANEQGIVSFRDDVYNFDSQGIVDLSQVHNG